MERPARMTREPFPHLGLLVRAIVVEDGVNDFTGGDLALDGVEETDELRMPETLHGATTPSRRGRSPCGVLGARSR